MAGGAAADAGASSARRSVAADQALASGRGSAADRASAGSRASPTAAAIPSGAASPTGAPLASEAPASKVDEAPADAFVAPAIGGPGDGILLCDAMAFKLTPAYNPKLSEDASYSVKFVYGTSSASQR